MPALTGWKGKIEIFDNFLPHKVTDLITHACASCCPGRINACPKERKFHRHLDPMVLQISLFITILIRHPVGNCRPQAAPGAERLNAGLYQQASRLEVFHARQIVKVLKTKLIQKLIASAPSDRFPRRPASSPGRIQPASKRTSIVPLLNPAPDLLDLRPGDRLMISNNGQGFDGSTR